MSKRPGFKPCPNPGCTSVGQLHYQFENVGSPRVRIECLCGTAGPWAAMHGERMADGTGEAVGLWNALPRALRWTTEPPSVPGWCWVRSDGGPAEMVRVSNPVEARGREYAGPVLEPIEPSAEGGAA